MKFGELRKRCQARAWRLHVERARGQTGTQEISLDYTVEPDMKLARWDRAEVITIKPTVTLWPVGYVNTLEVILRANDPDDD